MRLHPREPAVHAAETQIRLAVEKIIYDDNDLTDGEIVRVVSGAFGDVLGRLAKGMIRMERHGDPEKEGGLA